MTFSKENINKWLSTVLSVIAIIGFVSTLLAYSYTEGQKEQRISELEKVDTELRLENKEIKIKLDGQFGELRSVNSKLELLLDYFHITDSTRHY
jgi:hypothetical protein